MSRRNLVGQIVNLPIDPHAHEPRAAQFLERGGAFLPAVGSQRRQQLDAAARGQIQQAIHDLRHTVPLDHPSALQAVRRPDPGVQHPQRVGDLAGRPHGGTRRMDSRLVRNAQRGRQPLDCIDLRLGALGQEVAGVGRQRFHVTPAALGIQHVERQRRFARSGHAGHDDELVARNGNGNVLEIVLARAANDDCVHAREPSRKPRPLRLSLPRRGCLHSRTDWRENAAVVRSNRCGGGEFGISPALGSGTRIEGEALSRRTYDIVPRRAGRVSGRLAAWLFRSVVVMELHTSISHLVVIPMKAGIQRMDTGFRRPPRHPGESRGLGERCLLDSGLRRNDEGGRTGTGGRRGLTRKSRLRDHLVYNSLPKPRFVEPAVF